MSYSYPLTMPSGLYAQKSSFTLKRVESVSSSPFTGAEQIYQHQGAWWEVELTLPPMNKTDFNDWLGFLLKLKGRVGTFYFSDPDGNVRGTALGSPVVAAGGFDSDMCGVASSGWTASKTGVLLPGDWVSFSNYEYKRVTTQVNSDSSGNATILFEPRQRTSVSAGTAIATSAAKGIFRLVSPDTTWISDEAKIYGFTLLLKESLT